MARINPARFKKEFVKDSFTVNAHLAGAEPATAGNFGYFWTAPAKCVVDSIDAVWSANGGSGATVNVEKVPSATAQGSGTNLLSTAIVLSSGAATIAAGSLSTTVATLELAQGDSLALVDAGTLTSLADLAVTVQLHWIP